MSKTFEIPYILDFKTTLQFDNRKDNFLVKIGQLQNTASFFLIKFKTIFHHHARAARRKIYSCVSEQQLASWLIARARH